MVPFYAITKLIVHSAVVTVATAQKPKQLHILHAEYTQHSHSLHQQQLANVKVAAVDLDGELHVLCMYSLCMRTHCNIQSQGRHLYVMRLNSGGIS